MLNFIYITTSDKEEAKRVGGRLVEENLAACVNIIDGMTSIFPWEGKIGEDQETILIAKTEQELNERVKKRVEELHSYDCPCILVLPVQDGNQAFLDWVREEVDLE